MNGGMSTNWHLATSMGCQSISAFGRKADITIDDAMPGNDPCRR